jgi:L-arabinose isomerase
VDADDEQVAARKFTDQWSPRLTAHHYSIGLVYISRKIMKPGFLVGIPAVCFAKTDGTTPDFSQI